MGGGGIIGFESISGEMGEMGEVKLSYDNNNDEGLGVGVSSASSLVQANTYMYQASPESRSLLYTLYMYVCLLPTFHLAQK